MCEAFEITVRYRNIKTLSFRSLDGDGAAAQQIAAALYAEQFDAVAFIVQDSNFPVAGPEAFGRCHIPKVAHHTFRRSPANDDWSLCLL